MTKKTMLAAPFERLALTARPARVSEVDKAVSNSDWVRFLVDRLLKFPKRPSRHARECARQIAVRTVSPRETVIKSINRLINKENLTVTDDADGSLVIRESTKSGDAVATFLLEVSFLRQMEETKSDKPRLQPIFGPI